MTRRFTGRHMAMIMVGGFGIVIAVNFYMASLAVRGFGGVVVENSYVASQKFNRWLEEARASEALGYEASLAREASGHLRVTAEGLPAGAILSADLRRPLGKPQGISLVFQQIGNGLYRSTDAMPAGRWIARLAVSSADGRWVMESEVR